MPVNVQLPLAAQTADTTTPLNASADQQRANAIATEQMLKQHYEAFDAREKSRLSSTIVGAAQLKSFLDNNDVEGAKSFLRQRKQMLHQRMAYGENIDTQETDYALEALESGKIDELKNGVNGLIAAGQVYGIIPQSYNNPYVEQFKAVKAAHPQWTDAQVQDYVYTRGNVGKGTVFDASGNVVNQPGAVSAVSEKAGAEEFAKGAGGEAGKKIIANDTTMGNLQNMTQAITAAKTTLPKVLATGPIFGRVGAAAKAPEYINLMRDLNEITLLAKDLYNLGSGQGFTDADREFLKELSGGSYNRDESIQYALDRFEAALTNRMQFLQNQNRQYKQTYGGGNPQAAVSSAPSGGQQIRVVNPQTSEAFMIDPNDLAAAQAEGFIQQ